MPNDFKNFQDAEYRIISKEEIKEQIEFIKNRTQNIGGQAECQN